MWLGLNPTNHRLAIASHFQLKDKNLSVSVKITDEGVQDKSISVKVTGLAIASHFHMKDKRATTER